MRAREKNGRESARDRVYILALPVGRCVVGIRHGVDVGNVAFTTERDILGGHETFIR